MIPYFLLVFLPLLFFIFGKRYCIKINGTVLCKIQSPCIDIFMFSFLLLLSFRGLQCGIDTKQYSRLYSQYCDSSFFQLFSDYRHEYGFKILSKLVGVTFNHFQFFLCVSSVLCVLPLWFFYKRSSEHQLLTIALFLTVSPFMMYFSGIRQGIAMSMGLLAWYAVKNKKMAHFLLLVFLAMQFHTSAFILLLLYPLYTVRITKKWLWFVVPSIIAVFLLRKPIFNFATLYLWKDYNTTAETGATTILLLLVLFGIYSYIIPDENKLDDDTLAMRNILLLSIVIQIFAMLHPLSMRMNYYFLLFIPIVIPKIANRSKTKYVQVSKLSVIIMTAFFMCYFLNNVIKDYDDLNIIPYIPFWAN